MNKVIIIILAVFFLLIAIPRIIFPDLEHGDEWADADVLNASANFARFGFVKCHFLPYFELQFGTLKGTPYTHYPALAQIYHGALRIFFKTDSLRFFRGIALFVSLLSIIFWYLFVKRLTGSYIISFLSAIFYLANPFFIFGADNLTQMSYADFLRSLILFIFTACAYSSKEKRTGLLVFIWFLFFIQSLITFEYIIYMSLFFILFRYFFKTQDKTISFWVLIILFSAPVAAFLLHYLQNIWYFGSSSLTMQDFKTIAADRIFRSKDAPMQDYNFGVWWNYVIARNFSLTFIFNYFLLFLSVFFAYLFYQPLASQDKREIKILLRLFLLMIICGVSWYIVFPAHSFAHAFVHFLVRHIVPVAAVGFGLFFYILFCFIKENAKHKLIWRIFWAFSIIFVLFTGITKSELPVTKDNIKRAEDFIIFKKCLLKLRDMSGEKDLVGVNYYRRPFINYYTNRNSLPIFDKSSLEGLASSPRFFIFLPRDEQGAMELFQFLNQKYNLLFKCESSRFPGIFFELKK